MSPRRPATRLQPQGEALPAALHFSARIMPANAIYPAHKHAGGEFVYSFKGVMEIQVGDAVFLAPPQYGIWLPPDVEHIGLNRNETGHCSLYIARPHAERLPATACALAVSPLIVALLDHLRVHAATSADDAAHLRLLHVLVDLLELAPRMGSYLPSSSDPALSTVLRWIETHPDDNRTLAELAHLAHSSERTLMRRAQRDLGMPISEWRQRLRILKAMPLLASGKKVESVALELGYSSASAFIAMFRRLMQQTPAEYRQRGGTR